MQEGYVPRRARGGWLSSAPMRALLSNLVALVERMLGSGPGRAVGERLQPIAYGYGPSLMSRLRKAWILFTHPHAQIEFQGPVHIGRGFTLYMPSPSSRLVVGPDVEFRNGVRIEINGDGVVKIGARCLLSYNMLIQCTSSIEIGAGCGIGQSTAIYDGNHKFKDLETPFMVQGFDLRPIRIGAECGILTKTTVLNDIGDRCIIGANSVVARPIPAYCVAAGAPARVIDYFGPPGQEPDGFEPKAE
jgi:acetyltransferase-like isoleucine patch superfamily enzyme